jgi:hypothetical protein
MTPLKRRVDRLEQRLDQVDREDTGYLLSESDCERFASAAFRGRGGVLRGEYAAAMLLDGCSRDQVRAELANGFDVLGHRRSRPFLILDLPDLWGDGICRDPAAGEPGPPTAQDVQDMIDLVLRRLGS